MAQSPLSVLHVCAPAPYGGLETVVQGLAKGFAGRGHAVTVVAVVEPGHGVDGFLEPMDSAGVRTVTIECGRRAYIEELRKVRALLSSIAPDVLHTHGHRPDLLHPPGARSAGVATVSTLHGFGRLGGLSDMLEWLQVRAARYLDAAIAVSSTIVERLAHAGVPRERIHHVPNGWVGRKDRLGRDHARAELGVPPDTACIGWMGRLTAIKGPDVFVRSLARLTTREWTACIIGDGPDRARLENLADSVGIGDKVRFTGFVQDAGRFVGAFDTFVLSSHSEGTPMALLEAMDAGLPVVATEVGGVPHVVRIPTDGWLVPPDAPDALARAIDECLADRDEASRRGRAGQQRVRAVFEPDRWLERHERIYREAIGVRAARSG